MKLKYLTLAIISLQTPAFAQTEPAASPAEPAVPPVAVEDSTEEAPETPAEDADSPSNPEATSPTRPSPEPNEVSASQVTPEQPQTGMSGRAEVKPQASEPEEAEPAPEEAPAIEVPVIEAPVAEAPPPEPGATINRRPAGEEELMAPHAVNLEKITFDPGTGLTFKSQDESFKMAIRLRIQFRDELESEKDGGLSTMTNTFGIRRARLQFKGNIFSKYVKYKAEFALSPRDLSLQGGATKYTPLLSWYTDFTYLRDLSLRVGQYKLLYSRQRVVSSGDQEFVDRNIAQNEFNLDRDIGVHLFSKDLLGLDLFRYYLGVSIGEGRDVYEAEDTSSGQESHQYLARIEVLPFGDFEDYSEVDFERLDKFRLSFGAAYAYLQNGSRSRGYRGDDFADEGSVKYHNATADVMIKWAGMTIFSDFFYREGKRTEAIALGDEEGNLPRNGLGGSVQVGYLIPTIPLGVGVRYGGVSTAGFDSNETALSDSQELGATVGWYMAGHNLKLQADYFHTWGDDFSTNAIDRARIQLQVAY